MRWRRGSGGQAAAPVDRQGGRPCAAGAGRAATAGVAPWILVHIITRLELGGAQRVCLEQVAQVQLAGCVARYLLYGPNGPLDAEAWALAGVVPVPVPALVRPLRPVVDAQAVWHIGRTLGRIRRQHPGARLLVHTHSSKAGIVGRLAAAAARAERVVHTLHGFGHQPGMPRTLFWALQTAERAAARTTHGLVAVSHNNLARARAEGLVRPHTNTTVIVPAIEVAHYARPQPLAEPQDFLPPHTTPMALTVSCMKPQKDPDTWLMVVALVARAWRAGGGAGAAPQPVFLWAGDGVLRARLAARVVAQGLTPFVRLLGWRHDVAALLQRAQVLLHTARWEGLPQVFLQAMAAGLPVVATRVDGAEEAIAHGRTGYLAAAGDAQLLARYLMRLLHAPHRARAMGAAGRARLARKKWHRQASLAQLGAFYGQVLTNPAGRG